jgi:hypothetical protein
MTEILINCKLLDDIIGANIYFLDQNPCGWVCCKLITRNRTLIIIVKIDFTFRVSGWVILVGDFRRICCNNRPYDTMSISISLFYALCLTTGQWYYSNRRTLWKIKALRTRPIIGGHWVSAELETWPNALSCLLGVCGWVTAGSCYVRERFNVGSLG